MTCIEFASAHPCYDVIRAIRDCYYLSCSIQDFRNTFAKYAGFMLYAIIARFPVLYLPIYRYETLTKVASICKTCGSINRTLFLYNVGFLNCKGLPSK